jgi:hypothetical protein
LCPSLSMGCVPLYPWVVSLFIHGSCPSLSMGCVPLYPWIMYSFIHGSCPPLSRAFSYDGKYCYFLLALFWLKCYTVLFWFVSEAFVDALNKTQSIKVCLFGW